MERSGEKPGEAERRGGVRAFAALKRAAALVNWKGSAGHEISDALAIFLEKYQLGSLDCCPTAWSRSRRDSEREGGGSIGIRIHTPGT